MATLIGIVSKVIGQVFAVASDGTRRALVEGDKLFAGDQLSTGAEGAVAVHLQNGQELTLGRGSSMQMTPQLLANHIPHVDSSEAVTPSQAQLTDVQQLQKAIAAGDDPTQTAEATAAGPATTTTGAPGGVQGSGHSFVMLEEVGGRVDPTIGFPTAGFNGIPELPEERLNADPNNNVVAADAPVVPPVTPEVPEVPNNPVTLDGLSVANGELTVNEANLADGSARNPGALTQSGSFTVNAPDGLSSLSIGGINVISGGVAAGFPQSITTLLGSTLTVTGYNPATGVVSYSYTLNGAETHASGEGANAVGEHFTVVAGDSNGDSATGSLDINITDDVPQAIDDGNGVASETLLTLNGNVLTNDVQGADRVPVGENSGPITPGTFIGTYGTLVLNANGTYTYTLNTSDADFKALHGGGDGTETFTYTLTDADGDSSTANLVLQIHNNDDPDTIGGLNLGGPELTVFEKNLGDGSAPDATALTQNGTFTFTALDGITTLTVGGIAVVSGGVAAGFPQSITTPLGNTLTITSFDLATGVVNYSYTLNDNEAHATANGANALPEQFDVTLVDDNGTTATGSLDVNIVDDLPQGVNDSNASTASETLLTLNGNVLTNDVQGADRLTVGENAGPITPGTFTGTYGTLVLNANGTYTYTLNTSDADFKALHGGGDGTETFTYTITDSDGDSSTANLVLQIHNNDDPVTIGGLNVEGGELTVFEKNLGDGSAPDATALTQNGTFTVTALDGVTSLTVGGIAVVTAGVAAGFPQSITTPLGSTLTITGFNAATGIVSYSYTLVDNEAHATANGANTLPEQFAVTLVDDNGTTATGSLDVNIVDDLPQGVNDSNASTASETLLTLNGNVLTNDVQGADRVTVGENAGPITPGTFTGTYGTLVLNANGTYTYTLNTSDADFKALHGGGDGTETFTYTITDSDGDSSTANLVLQIHNNDDPVTIGGLNVEGGELTVFEKNLGDGSAPDATALTQNGTFTVSALDGVTSLTVGGIAVVTAGVAAGFPQSITTPLGSTLTITGFNAATGVVSYSYTLNDNEAHATANGANTLPEQFAVTVVDDNGTTATGSLDVNIVDDLPQGVNDSNASTASETLLTLNGNVLTNDVQGADRVTVGENAGPVTPGTFTGTYGTLVLNANGTYTYTLNTSDADFKALHGGGDGTETFTYTITDSDGDSSTANLVLQIHNNDDPVTIGGLNVEGGELTVFEKNLGDGSNPDTPALTQSGTFTVTALDGVTTLTVGGIAVVTAGVAAGFPQSITTPLGSTLTITGFNAATGVVSYSYTLNDNEAHATANGANTLPEQFAVTVVDDNGTTATGSLDVNIVDDLPQGVNDSNASTASETLLTLNGNVLTNDVQGADRVTVGENAGPITPGTFTGTYGTLVLNANGTYTYTLNTSDADFKALHGGGDGTETFTYTITDSDGDSSTANLVLQIHNNDDPVTIGGLNVEGGELTVFEKNLGDGSNPDTPALTQSGTFTVTALDGVSTLTVGGISVVTGGVAAGFPQSITTPLGSTLTITGFNAATGVVSYSYTLNDNEAHATANGANTLPEQFAVTVVDDNGTTATGSLDVNIVDDLPQGVNDSNTSTASETLLTLNGNVLTNDVQGADRVTVGENAGPITPGTFTGTYGTLVLNANGTYTYTLNTSDADFKALHGGGDGTETFTYTITDSDGDSSTANLVLQIHNNDDPVTIGGLNVEGGELTVFEKNLGDGSAPDATVLTQNGSFTVTALDGVTSLTVGGIAVVTAGVAAGFPQSITTPLGSTLTITGFNAATGVVSYSYTLNDNEAHATANGANTLPEQFAVTVVDDNGTTATGSLDVNIVDDLPQGVNDSNTSTASETLLTLNGNVLTNDVQGADRVTVGENAGPITPGTFTGTYGTLVLNANGTYTYTLSTSDADFKALHGGGNGSETFTYTITDSDGDSSTANLVLQIHNNDDPVTLQGLNVYGGELTVYEKNLGDGSNPNPSALTQSGTFTVTALDGVTTLTVGGIAVVTGGVAAGFPQSITTPLGSTLTITGFNAATGVVSYSYTLNDNETHANANGANTLPEQFTVTAVDDNGTTATGNLDVNIVDDLPKGVNDSNGTASETQLTLNGNVLTNDVQGADRVTVGENAGPITPGTFTGTYGTLVLNANGTYTYTLSTSDADFKALHGGGNGSETFTYTITDSDGDSSTANLVLQIHNNDDPVTLQGLNVYGGELTVYEKNLGDGSNPNPSALTQSGTFTVTALDGVTTLTVGGIAVVTGGVAAGFPQSITTPLGSTLTITGFNAATGVVSYSYTLNDNETHANANGANTLPEQFAVTVVDDNGTTATGSLDVNIVDDLPQGVNDSNTSTASETLLTLNGNVLTNDVQGADRVTVGENAGPITPGTFTGTYGTLVLNANGTYTYTLSTSDADFKALHGGGNGSETFTYTITDSDGDSSTANLVLQIHNNDDPVTLQGLNVYGGELTVYEKNLSDGSAPSTSALTQSGTFTVTALDGVTTLTVGGISVVTGGVAAGFPQSITTPLGSTLTITGFNAATGVVSYSYTLNDNETHANANGANTLPEQFTVTAVDDNGTTATGNLDVNIVDDLPKGVNDSNGTASETQLTLNGNVLTNDVQGADRVTVGENAGPITPGTFTGTYGTLVLNANGTYTYTLSTSDADFKALHGGGNGSETFTYTITDSDGDSSTANLVLQIHNNDDPVTLQGLNVYGGELTVYEKNLGDGTHPDTPALSQSGTFTVTALDGLQTLTVGTLTVISGGVVAGFPQTATTPLGSTLTITGFNAATGVISYTYTLNDNEAHPAAEGANSLTENFNVVATDTDGDVANGQINVNIIDDLPTANPDTDSVQEGGTVSGNVLDNDIAGADGPAATGAVVGVRAGSDTSTPALDGLNTPINGTYGYLTLDANGNAVYHSTPNAVSGPGAVDVFTYTVRDSDGDESTTTITIDVYNSCLKAVSDNDVTVYEKALDLGKDGQDLVAGTVIGSDPTNTGETASGTLVGSVTHAVGAITYALVGTHVGEFGQIQLNANGTYTYTLTTPPSTTPHANDGPNVMHETFTYQATDSLGNIVTSTIVVDIVDDVPKAMNDSNASTASETTLSLSGNVFNNDVIGADKVALGLNAGPVTPGTFTGTYGTLVLNANGTYTYTLSTSDADFKALHGGGNGTETFTYTITDSDGDISTANLVLNVHNNDDLVTLNGLDVYGGELTVYEKNLGDGTTPNISALTQSGTFTVTALDGLQTLTVGTLTVISGGVVAGFPQTATTPLGSTLTITGFNPVTGVLSYSYTLNDNEAHATASGANSLTENFNVVATDTDGDIANGQINVNIVDDLPGAKPDSSSVTEGGTVNISVLGNDISGADGPATVVGVRAGSNTSTSAVGGLGNQITGAYGYLTLDANGNAVYHANPNSVGPAGATDTFTYTVRDTDGDESTTTITVNVANSIIKANPDSDVTVYEKALDLSKDGQDLAAGTVTGSDPGNSGETSSGTLVGSVSGASGALTYTLVGSATGTYGQILLNADGSYTYTLTSAPKTSPNANDGPNSLSESFTYKATDASGNSSTSTIVVNIVDDVPKAVAADRSVAAVEIDSNLLIVLDVSGSMVDPSGVPGLSRLELAKQAISALLDKYDDLGDVKVQLVTFSSSATDRTSVWVDVATAKTLLTGLTADGGTNYDAAVATMKTAFNTSGKLTGAQNVGYFFSDGKPTSGQEIGTSDETSLKAFLDANNIKNYAIGLGSGVSNANLNPLAYDGSSHTDTNAVVVTDLNQLNSVLSGTVIGAPVTGSLLGEGGTFGADGGFIKTITVDGTTYTYDPAGNGSLNFSGAANHGTFNTANNTLSIATNNSGTLLVNLDSGEYTYISQKTTAVVITENIGFTVSDNDGDLSSSTLTIKVIPNAPPVATDDHVITNVLEGTVVVPGELLLANDTDPNGDPLSANPTSFNTGWVARGAEFTGLTQVPNFTGSSAQALTLARSAFVANAAAMTAVLVVSGALGSVGNSNYDDRITVNLKDGETLHLNHDLAAGRIAMEYSINGGAFTPIADGGMITATSDATYQIHISNIPNSSSGGNGSETYKLTMTVNYSEAHDIAPDYHGTYTANDNHGGSDSANVTISYQDGHTLTGTGGDDVLVAGAGSNVINAGGGNDVLTAGSGNNELHGDAGNDLLFSGPGNDTLDGGTGIDTASYAHATAGVTVNLSLLGGQNTLGAGTDILTGIENLTGSNFNDTLTGDNTGNVITGGLGNDVLNGGGGDDLLIGGLGNNTLSGGAGADTFQWLKGNSGHDVITDFTPGTDKLDLSQLLQGENGTTASLDDYLHFTVTGSGPSTVTSIDVSAMAGAAPNQTIDLAGVDLASHYGVTPGAGGVIAGGHDTATIINGMLNDHSLKVDTV
ncbi:retention module-containing protein [Pseudomonas sp. S2_H10]